METQAKHTPTPWYARKHGGVNSQRSFIHTKAIRSGLDKGKCRVIVDDVSHLDAEFIVKACNSHAGLVRQLESAYTALLMNDGPERASMEYQALLIFCRGAIASALDESDEVVQNRCKHEAIQRKLQNT